jgi:hypothetical protein
MIRKLIAVSALVLAAQSGTFASAQSTSVTIVALDGRNGKPLPSQRLVVFAGNTLSELRVQKYSFDLTTDQNGFAILTIDRARASYIRVFVDFKTLCQSGPSWNLDLAEIVAKGLIATNDCGSIARGLKPNQLTIFARPATLREKMAW